MPKKTYYCNPSESSRALKSIEWIGSALDDVRAMPEDVKDEFGYALHEAQIGNYHASARQLKGALRGLIELVDDFDGDTYRAIYAVKLAGVVYALHVFQKKATDGIATPRREIALIKSRWLQAQRHYATHYGSAK